MSRFEFTDHETFINRMNETTPIIVSMCKGEHADKNEVITTAAQVLDELMGNKSSAEDIANYMACDFARKVYERLNGRCIVQSICIPMQWEEDAFKGADEFWIHEWVEANGLHFDPQSLNGLSDWMSFPAIKNALQKPSCPI